MRRAGVDLVSIGIFSWALIEPREGEFDFGWLDDVIDRLHAAGIGISLGTPTASPPAWFWTRYPDARPVNRTGVSLGFGSRGMASPSSPDYHRAVRRVVTALARRYGRHPALKIWHVHNEYGAPVSDDYSSSSVVAFRRWLVERYSTLEAVNTAWGTTFWGQRYGDWQEIDVPRLAATTVNPAQQLDFARFTSDALLGCFLLEKSILREHSPGVPITTNYMATSCPSIDYWKWSREMDVVSNDHYLTAARPDAHVMLSMDADLVRSLAGGKPWLLMEHSTSAVNWQERNIAKRPGELARNSLAHFARGADGIMFFQWRASRFGAEKFHSAMLPHAGSDSRVFRETEALGASLVALSPALGSTVSAKVAILWDWESNWALDLEWRPSEDLSQRRQTERLYTRLWRDGITTDFAHPESDLSRYDLVIAPTLYLMSAQATANLDAYVARGGVLLVTYFSGIVDPHDTIPSGPHPGGMRGVLGLHVDEFRPLRAGETVALSNGVVGTIWTEDVRPRTATVVASYEDGPSAGGAAITRNEHGEGVAWYLASEFDVDALVRVLEPVLADARIAVDAGRNEHVETVVRRSGTDTFTTYINHGDVDVVIPNAGEDLLTGETVETVLLPAGAVTVVQR